jgi:phosphomannomutase
MRELEAEGGTFVFGFEEALGSMVGTVVSDKDGISAAVALAELARDLAGRGEDVLDRLAALARAHGVWVSRQRSVTHEGPEGAARIASAMRRVGEDPPSVVGGLAVREVIDHRRDAGDRPAWLGTADLVELRLDAGRVMIRPSGTEPKCKVYVDLRGELGADGDLAAAESTLASTALTLADDLATRVGLV